MNNGAPAIAGVQQSDPRPIITHRVTHWEVVANIPGQTGKRLLRGHTAFELLMFEMSVEDAIALGRALSAPGVIAAG
jgi:hypothetical protein